jgi:hypothetical protein
MKSTKKPVKLDRNKLFGFSQPGSGKAGSKNEFAKPAIGTKTVGTRAAAFTIAMRTTGTKAD